MDDDHLPGKARLYDEGSWCPSHANSSFLQFDLLAAKEVFGIAIQGDEIDSNWVTEFDLEYGYTTSDLKSIKVSQCIVQFYCDKALFSLCETIIQSYGNTSQYTLIRQGLCYEVFPQVWTETVCGRVDQNLYVNTYVMILHYRKNSWYILYDGGRNKNFWHN